MTTGLWPSLCQVGLAANRPTVPSEFPDQTFCFYFAYDSNALSLWNPVTSAWSDAGSPAVFGTVAAAGASQLAATPITTRKVLVTTATASSKGVLLPSAATGLEVEIRNSGPTFGVKVYPFTHDKINAGSSNAADTTVLAVLKTTIYKAVDTVTWVSFRGA
jgi:hypothetical protein